MFISVDEDKIGILDFIDEKIARVIMIFRENGEVFMFNFLVFYKLLICFVYFMSLLLV